MPAALRRTIIALLTIAAAVLLSALPAAAGTVDDEAGFISRINADRTANGLPAYSRSPDLTAVARRHAQRMADRSEHYHNPNLANEVGGGWTLLGENVGQGPNVDGLHRAFMDSPGHRANILRREFTQVGIGVVRNAAGRIFVVEVFRQPAQTAAAPAPAPTPAPAPRAAPAPAPKPAAAPAPAPKPAPTPAPKPAPKPAPAPAPTTTTIPAVPYQTSDTLGASAAPVGAPVVAAVNPASASRSVAGPALMAGLLIGVLFAAHTGIWRRMARTA